MRFIFAAIAVTFASSAGMAQQRVDGYVKQDGTYVAPHFRSAPDNSRSNNWTSQGNVNPYTGQTGTRDPYAPQPTYRPNTYGSGVNNLNNQGRPRY